MGLSGMRRGRAQKFYLNACSPNVGGGLPPIAVVQSKHR
ncbi:hypothetical protein EMIT0357P_10568 [Pseudomonas marginalis]